MSRGWNGRREGSPLDDIAFSLYCHNTEREEKRETERDRDRERDREREREREMQKNVAFILEGFATMATFTDEQSNT